MKKIGIVGAGNIDIAAHINHGVTVVDRSSTILTNAKGMRTIDEIIKEEASIKITNTYKDYMSSAMLYDSVTQKKRGTNLTPKKKKRKK